MTTHQSVVTVFWLGLAGSLFSGFLSVIETFAPQATSCPAIGASGTVLGFPSCIYGFALFLTITIVAGLGFRRR
jgi:uncharacterized membrane protein